MSLAQAGRPDQTQRPALGDEAVLQVAHEDLAVELGAQPESVGNMNALRPRSPAVGPRPH
jgi:hypothetical protein